MMKINEIFKKLKYPYKDQTWISKACSLGAKARKSN